ncbi:DUF1998 domain-containing protein [Chryseobacterium manosquense]|uniref:DUF1998 domain-containing protein n=1 Tax=Chryseobacterium manosquense TaxID=2754694 RepID=A0A7H1DZR4_9FLAO|nr:DUF1998 domain-containing protein [Chryseobacterium manosquense]QNS42472.1 DUF1998 domain-containing protein [Chryseobacterium manosquense]
MKILSQYQYNQGIGKYKLLSSTSGVGSIITTKIGSYVLISDINKWKFFDKINKKLKVIRENNSDEKVIYKLSEDEVSYSGIRYIDDKRFIDFIKEDKSLKNLICLIGIPQMSLNEVFNSPNWNNHPIKKTIEKNGEVAIASTYMITGTLFPKWFKNKKGQLKKLNEWYKIFEEECKKQDGKVRKINFAPPRDGKDYLRTIEVKNEDGTKVQLREYRELDQSNLILVCPNGHLSDIPWSNFLRWRTENFLNGSTENDNAENLFSTDSCGPCCGNPDLIWTENTTKSEGYGSIYIECKSCELGSGKSKEKPKINLEGINGIKPKCPGHMPWQKTLEENQPIPYEECLKENSASGKERETMQLALVTANNIYYANGFSSIYIPLNLALNKSEELLEALNQLNLKYQKRLERKEISKVDFWISLDFEDFLIDNDFKPEDENKFKESLELEFLNETGGEENEDKHEIYRLQEYNCFVNNSNINVPGLMFNDIVLPPKISEYFSKICQVEELRLTSIQLDFTRVKPKERIVIDGNIRESSSGQNIFSCDSNELFVLPANETLGEGIFLKFNDEKIVDWIGENTNVLKDRYAKYFEESPDLNSQGISSKMKIFNNQYKHFIIHTFSHLFMRELEFSCGYPTASLKERLYISNNENNGMSGLLIYTAEGSEGSMGGLVSQAEPEKIMEIIIKCLNRSIECSSDPLCWESDGQGLFDLNLASCFSCSLVSETACEEWNLGLDRRSLVDEEFGFFKELL